jgi:hypothetical protein
MRRVPANQATLCGNHQQRSRLWPSAYSHRAKFNERLLNRDSETVFIDLETLEQSTAHFFSKQYSVPPIVEIIRGTHLVVRVR